MSKPRAVVAMSGGVDSSVAAALMVERGYDVTGIMLKLWRGETANTNSGCCNIDAAEDARRVADQLGIDFYVLNFAERFEDSVVRDFRETYARGQTPNPCVRCNQWIKFDALLERADALGADVLVTGHYARVRRDGSRYRLLRGIDRNKDQSYVLWMLDQDTLARVMLPIGEMDKTTTRAIAAELGLRTAAKPDSQEICFVRAGDLGAYMDAHVPASSRPGPIVDTGGRVVGEHAGIGHYTVGQRRGLGIALGHPVFVTAVDAATNTVVIGSRAELVVAAVVLDEVSFTSPVPDTDLPVWFQYRAHGGAFPATLRVGERVTIEAHEDLEAVAPGQSAALYSYDDPAELIGGGIIGATRRAVVA